MEDSRQDLRTEDEKRNEDGGMRMEESGKRVEEGGWRNEDRGMKMEEGRWKMEEMPTSFLTLQSSFPSLHPSLLCPFFAFAFLAQATSMAVSSSDS
jgi:hypothetical protein